MKVFLSYRTADTEEFTENLHIFLRNELQVDSVKGGESIPAGRKWRRWITNEISSSDVFIPVIGPDWEVGDGTRNIQNQDDIVRLEVETAINKKIRIIPLLVDRDELHKEKIPSKLHVLGTLQHKFAKMKFEKQGLPSFIVELRQIADNFRPKPVVLLSSTLAFLGDKESTEGLDYFMTLFMSVIQGFKANDREVIPKIPQYVGTKGVVTVAANQKKILREIVENLSCYSGLIIAPFEIEPLRDELVKLLERDGTFPVATIDKAYSRDGFWAKRKPPAGSVGNGLFNGELAAKAIINYLRQANISDPNVVVLQGLEGSDERVKGFINAMNKHNSNTNETFRIHLSVSRETEFLSNKAFEEARKYKQSNDWSSLNDPRYMKMITSPIKRAHETVDAFFCCNDEMALGVWELLEDTWNKNRVVEPTVVVGYDGIAAVRRKISRQDPWLLNSVDVKMGRQIELLLDAFEVALQKRTRVPDIEPVEGVLVDPDQQAAHVDHIFLQRKTGWPTIPSSDIPRRAAT